VKGGKHSYYTCPYKAAEADVDVGNGLSTCDVPFEAIDGLAAAVAAVQGPVVVAQLPPLPVWVRGADSQQYRPGWLVLDKN